MIRERRDNKGRLLRTNESQIKNGSYVFRYFDPETGKRKSVTCWRLMPEDPPVEGRNEPDSLRELEDRINRAISKKTRKLAEPRYTLNDYWEKFITTKCNIAESTMVKYVYLYNKHIREELGRRLVTVIRYEHIRRFYAKKMKEGLSFSSISHMHNIIEPVLEIAFREHLIDENPATGVIKEFSGRREWEPRSMDALTVKQQKVLVEYVASSLTFREVRPILTVFLGTGLRGGELIGLTWQNVDFERGSIIINHTLHYDTTLEGRCHYYITYPKTRRGIREIPMFTDVRNALQELYEHREDHNSQCQPVIDGHTNFVFRDIKGKLYTTSRLNLRWRNIVKAYNEEELHKAAKEGREPYLLPKFTCHTLRHTFCTRLFESNKVSIKSVQKLMGHAFAETAIRVYYACTTERNREEMLSLDGTIKLR